MMFQRINVELNLEIIIPHNIEIPYNYSNAKNSFLQHIIIFSTPIKINPNIFLVCIILIMF